MSHDFLLLILSSPSGAGKTTLTRKLQERFPELRFSVSHTTRQPARNEVDGKDYHFVHARAASTSWWTRGVPRVGRGPRATSTGRRRRRSTAPVATPSCGGIIFDIDYQGARQIRAKVHDAIGVFILPPSMEELERRLRGRASDSEEVMLQALRKRPSEIDHYALFDYVS